jgi:hypothetical protein
MVAAIKAYRCRGMPRKQGSCTDRSRSEPQCSRFLRIKIVFLKCGRRLLLIMQVQGNAA